MKKYFFLLLAIVLFPASAFSDASIPAKDIADSHDPAFMKRYQGSYIVAYLHRSYDRFTFPLSPLKPTGQVKNDNNLYEPEKKKALEGEYTRAVYLMPKDVSPLEIIRNYENDLKGKGASILYSCQGSGCGGSSNNSCFVFVGNMSLSMYLQDMEQVKSYNKQFSTGYCALTAGITGQQYIVAQLPDGGPVVSVLSYVLKDAAGCEAIMGRSVAIVDVLQPKYMEQKMVVIKAEDMAADIASQGKVALYGIYFDTGKADIKPDSMPTLRQIARLLKENPGFRILVVGHTDNQGTFSYNLDLSMRRAEAVVNTLVRDFGIKQGRLRPVGVGYACPRASNKTKEGRAKNRRVELVEQ